MGFDASSSASLNTVQSGSCLMDQLENEASFQQATIKWAPSVCSGSEAGSRQGSESGYGCSQAESMATSRTGSRVSRSTRTCGSSQAESVTTSQAGSQACSQIDSTLGSIPESGATSQTGSQAGSQIGSQVGSQVQSAMASIPESGAVGSRRSSKGGSSVASSAQERILKGSRPKPPPDAANRHAGRPTAVLDKSSPRKVLASAQKPDPDCAGKSSRNKDPRDGPRSARKMVDRGETFLVPEEARKPRNVRNSTAGAPAAALDGHYRGKELAPREITPFVESDQYQNAQDLPKRSMKKLASNGMTPYVESDKYEAPTAQYERQRGVGKALKGQGPKIDEDMAGQTTSRKAQLHSPFKPPARTKPDSRDLAGAAGASANEMHQPKTTKKIQGLAVREDTAETVFGGEKCRPDPPFLDYQDKSSGTKFVGRKVHAKPTKEVKELSRYKEEQYMKGPIPAGVEPKARNHWLHDDSKKEPPKLAKGAQKSVLSLSHSNEAFHSDECFSLTRKRRVEPNFVESKEVAGMASSGTSFRCDRSDAGYSSCSAPNWAAGASPRWGQSSQISFG